MHVTPALLRTYRMYGLAVRSDLPFPGFPEASSAPVDLDLRCGGPRRVPSQAPLGEILAERQFAGNRGYYFTRHPGGYVARFVEFADFEFDPGLRHCTAWWDPSQTAEVIELFFCGNVLSKWLMLKGHLVLHASAVAWKGRALAFLADSGFGKSSLAAAFCAAGASLITDDVLRLEISGDQVFAHRGPSELRMRPSEVTQALTGLSSRKTADLREAVSWPAAGDRTCLDAIVVPMIARERKSISLEAVDRPRAFFLLNAYVRVSAWKSHEMIRQNCERLAPVAIRVPLFEAELPWGAEALRKIPGELFQNLGWGEA